MKRRTAITAFLLAGSFALPALALAACPSPQVELNGACYLVNNGIWTPTGDTPTGGTQTTPTGGVTSTGIKAYSDAFISIVNTMIVPALGALAFLLFLWGVYKYFILGAASDEERKNGRGFILWGIIGFVVIFGVWSLVNLVMGTFGFTAGGSAPNAPLL